ncbi:hypothetical protein AB0B89_29055 [Sphaerisporangium sp. NPDC049002]|uniref:hypothetical protein n=1 Tax=Sphaerisporangium sp. NPDC049002 TaxID=3155392 RepID=UPI0033F904A1
MAAAPHHSEVHRMVDRLAPGQVEALYVILQSMVGQAQPDSEDIAGGEPAAPEVPQKHRFSFIGIMDGEPELAERSAQILREELGNPAA